MEDRQSNQGTYVSGSSTVLSNTPVIKPYEPPLITGTYVTRVQAPSPPGVGRNDVIQGTGSSVSNVPATIAQRYPDTANTRFLQVNTQPQGSVARIATPTARSRLAGIQPRAQCHPVRNWQSVQGMAEWCARSCRRGICPTAQCTCGV